MGIAGGWSLFSFVRGLGGCKRGGAAEKEDAKEGCGRIGCCGFDGGFPKQPGEGVGSGRVVL